MESVWAPQTPFAPRPFEETLLEIRNPAAGRNPCTASLMPLRGRFPESSLFWLYTILSGASIVFVASLFLGQSATATVKQANLKPRVRAKLFDDDHDPPPPPSPLPDGPSISQPLEAFQDAKDPFCTQRLVQEPERSWNESDREFLAPRLVRNGTRSVLCFYDRLAHRLPAPYAYFPRQMALRYCTHVLYHAPFALDQGRLAYRNPGFDLRFGLAELRRVANTRGYGTKLLFSVGGEEADNGNWSRLAVDRKQRAQLARDIKSMLISFGYDGVNLHWATPGGRCGTPQDVSALTALVRYLGAQLRTPGSPRDYALSLMLPTQERLVELGRELGALAKLTDILIVQAHALYGPASPWLRCASPYEAAQGPSVRSLMNSLGARLFHGHWDKLCISQSLAALTFRTDATGANIGPGDPLPVTGIRGHAAYFEVCDWARQSSTNRECSFVRNGSTLAAFEGPEALQHKLARMALDGHGRLCIAVMDTHMDDALGACGGPMSPLLKRLYEDPLDA